MKKCIAKLMILLLFSGIIFFPINIYAEENSDSEGKKSVHTSAERLEYKEERVILTGNVVIIRDENRITSDNAELFRDENRAEIEDNVKAEYNQGTVNSRRLSAYMEEDRYVFEEDVVLVHNTAGGDEMTLESPYLELFTEDNSFNARDDVVINYQGRILKADNADYNGKTEILTLVDNVEIEDNGDWIRSEKAEFDLASEDEFTAEGAVELEFEID